MEKLVIVGAGGFGREVFWYVQKINEAKPTWDVLGFLDDNLHALDRFSHYPPILGKVEDYKNLGHPYVTCAIGKPIVRKKVVELLDSQDAQWATILYPTAIVGTGSTMGEGCIIGLGSGVTVDTRIGNHVHINCYAGAGHDVCIGDYCTISAYVDICGCAVLEEGVFLGSHASVLPSAHVGAWACVGAGSVVLRNVAPGITVFGVPAKRIDFPQKT